MSNGSYLTPSEYEYMQHFGFLPESAEEKKRMDQRLVNEEELNFIAMDDPFKGIVYTGAQSREEAEQVSKLKQITKRNDHGESLKQQIRSFSQSPEIIRRRLALQGLTVNTATPNQLMAIVNSLEEGGPVTEGVGRGAIPTRRTNRNVRRKFRVFTEKSRKPGSNRRNIYKTANALLEKHYNYRTREKQLLPMFSGVARRRKTRRGGRR